MKDIAICCASHDGESFHVNLVADILQRIGLDESYLQCGTHPPYHKETRENMFRKSEKFSGKHTGMLAACLSNGWDLESYLDIEHPLHQRILGIIRKYSSTSDIQTSVDGCSVPVFRMPLVGLARLFMALAKGATNGLETAYSAMTKFPEFVAGTERFDTAAIRAFHGKAVFKVGGEAVEGIGVRTENGKFYGIGIKILDGNSRARPAAVVAVLQKLNLVSDLQIEKLRHWAFPDLKNVAGRIVGKISVDWNQLHFLM